MQSNRSEIRQDCVKIWTFSVETSNQAVRVWPVVLPTITPPPPTMLLTYNCMVYEQLVVMSLLLFAQITCWWTSMFKPPSISVNCLSWQKLNVAIKLLQKGDFSSTKQTNKINLKTKHIFEWSWLGLMEKGGQILTEITYNGLEICYQLIPVCHHIIWISPVLSEFKKMDTSGQSSFTVLTVTSMPPGCASYMCT